MTDDMIAQYQADVARLKVLIKRNEKALKKTKSWQKALRYERTLYILRGMLMDTTGSLNEMMKKKEVTT